MQAALNGTLSGFNGVFFNPFGPSSQGLVNALFVTSVANSRSSTLGADASVSGPLFTLPTMAGEKSGGAVSLAVGVESRKDNLDNHSDPVGYLVTVGDLPYSGQRSVSSAYVELAAPVLPKLLTLQLAARYDRYDSFGSTTNPKFAFVSQPFSFLKFRGSYSRSFKAPDIGQLYQPAITTFTAALADPLNPTAGLDALSLRGFGQSEPPARTRPGFGTAAQ
jgi:iron complex outermembrane receptor protein